MIDKEDILTGIFKTRYFSLTLSNKIKYVTSFNFQSLQITMTCGYNMRNKMRWIVLTDRGGEVLLSQTFLKFNKRCELNFNAEVYDLSYYVTLMPKDPSKTFKDFDYINWSDHFDICFVGYENSFNDRLERNNRKRLVGN